MIRGREFTVLDTQDAPPVAIINQAMAWRYWTLTRIRSASVLR